MKKFITVIVTAFSLMFVSMVPAQAADVSVRKGQSKFVSQISYGSPKVCKKVPTYVYNVKSFKTKYDAFGATYSNVKRKKMFLELYVSPKYTPNKSWARTLYKHECGHILMNRIEFKSKKTLNNIVNSDKTWKKLYKKYPTYVEESLADCVADRLNGKRYNTRNHKTYGVGYGTKCTKSQYRVADKIIKYGKR